LSDVSDLEAIAAKLEAAMDGKAETEAGEAKAGTIDYTQPALE